MTRIVSVSMKQGMRNKKVYDHRTITEKENFLTVFMSNFNTAGFQPIFLLAALVLHFEIIWCFQTPYRVVQSVHSYKLNNCKKFHEFPFMLL